MKITFGREMGLRELAKLLGSALLFSSDCDQTVKGLCTDSREADESTAFVALRGERVDGHDFIPAALERGCPAVIAQRADAFREEKSAALLLVSNCEAALLTLARSYLDTLTHRTVAVTGSVGKTTTKDMISAVLSQKMNTYCSSGNHNSIIGMPLSAMEVAQAHSCAVFEMGMSARGEIEAMSLCARPDIAVITNIGTSHMEMLGSRENIRDAKMEILQGLKKDGILLFNGDEPLLCGKVSKSYRTLSISVLSDQADFFAKNIYIENDRTYFDAYWKDGCLKGLCLSVAGRHNVYAGLFALAVGVLLGANEEEIRRGLLSYTAEGLRQNVCRYKDLTLIEDCYNASPESMRASLDVLEVSAKARRIACLGEMLELGEQSALFHREVGAYAVRKGIDLLFCIGADGGHIAAGAVDAGMKKESVFAFPDRADVAPLCRLLCESLLPGDTLLIKGSRGVKLERVIEYLKNNY